MNDMKKLLVLIALAVLLLPVAGCQDFNSTLAPIEAIAIDVSTPDPLSNVTVSITYGLPDSCYSFDKTKVVDITDGFDIGVWIKKPVSAEACDQVFRTETTAVNLGSKFEPGKSYTIRINGVERKITIPEEGAGDEEMVIKPAPIVNVDVRIAESFPPQVFIDIRGILTDGCTALNGVEVTRQGTVIDITVTTQRPRDAVCIQVISFFDTVVPLGSNFIAGQNYTLRVNGKAQQFNVSTGIVPPPDIVPPPGTVPPPIPVPAPGTAPSPDVPKDGGGIAPAPPATR